jgi:hypothetical protein
MATIPSERSATVISSSWHGGALVLVLGERCKIASRMNFGLRSLLLMGTTWSTEHRLPLDPLFRSKMKRQLMMNAVMIVLIPNFNMMMPLTTVLKLGWS